MRCDAVSRNAVPCRAAQCRAKPQRIASGVSEPGDYKTVYKLSWRFSDLADMMPEHPYIRECECVYETVTGKNI